MIEDKFWKIRYSRGYVNSFTPLKVLTSFAPLCLGYDHQEWVLTLCQYRLLLQEELRLPSFLMAWNNTLQQLKHELFLLWSQCMLLCFECKIKMKVVTVIRLNNNKQSKIKNHIFFSYIFDFVKQSWTVWDPSCASTKCDLQVPDNRIRFIFWSPQLSCLHDFHIFDYIINEH